jgi:hypothetical protein
MTGICIRYDIITFMVFAMMVSLFKGDGRDGDGTNGEKMVVFENLSTN